MRLAVLQHASPDGTAAQVAADAAQALDAGADLVICAAVLDADSEKVSAALDLVFAGTGRSYILPTYDGAPAGSVTLVEIVGPFGNVGLTAVLVGDACFDSEAWLRVRDAGAVAAVFCPRATSELQAEAAVEVALALSDSLCGLVVVAETTGGAPGGPGHGGSAIISLGKVLAEALEGPDIIIAHLLLPLPQPEPPEHFPELPVLIAQRLSRHAGQRFDVGYPADLSSGTGPS